MTDSEGTIHVPSTYTVDRRSLIEGYLPEGRETYQRSVTIPLAAAVGRRAMMPAFPMPAISGTS
ncbi:hypothetical protein NKH23_25925 [Mesorhizobium sp. M1328]|uniref:hypothetical protein n=1 Tax=Mesorhizobium sp. M1328 TaxID=2957082 RepID=UPI0033357477